MKQTNVVSRNRIEDVANRINSGSDIEIYFTPDKGLEVDVNHETLLTAREFHITLTEKNGVATIRCNEVFGDVNVWHDIHLSDFSFYGSYKKIGESNG